MPGTTVEELLSHGPWARRLAAALISDRNEADDLVQDTWVAAMRRPPSASGSTKAWIGRVMRNLASNRRREGVRRTDRESSVARSELQPSSDDVAQELEMHRALVDALASIDSDQARTIVRRYFHGLSSAEISREERVPESTVRNRLMRGLEALRGKLDSKYGNRSAWAALLLPLARRGQPIVASASAAGGGALVASALVKVVAAAILVAIGTIALRSWKEESNRTLAVAEARPVRSTSELQSTADVGGRSEVAVEGRSTDGTRPTGSRAVDLPSNEEAPSWLEARVLDPVGRPIEGASLLVVDRLDADEIEPSEAPRATSGADGRLRIQVRMSDRSRYANGMADRGRWMIRVRIGAHGCESVDLHPTVTTGDTSAMGNVTLRPGGTLRGRVVCPGAIPKRPYVGVVTPQLSMQERASIRFGLDRPSLAVARVHADGSYEFSGVPVGSYRVVTQVKFPGCFAACSEAIEVRAGEGTEVPDLVLEANPNTIRGRIVHADGSPVGDKVVEYKLLPVKLQTREDRFFLAADVDEATGEFVIDCSRAGNCDLYARDRGAGEGEAVLLDVPTGTDDVVLTLRPLAFIDLIVQDEKGAPIPRYKIAHQFADAGFGQSDTGPRPAGRSRVLVHAVPFHFTVSADGYGSQEFGPFDLDHFPCDLTVILPQATALRGRITDHGVPVNRAKVWLKRIAPPDQRIACNGFPCRFDEGFFDPESSVEDGRFILSPKGNGPFAILTQTPDHRTAESDSFEYQPMSGLPDLEVQIRGEGTLEGHVLAPPDSVAGTIVGISRGDGLTRTIVVSQDGAYRFADLDPGTWWIRRCETDFSSIGGSMYAAVAGFDPSLQQLQIVDGATTTFDLDLRDATCELQGHLRSTAACTDRWSLQLHPKGDLGGKDLHAELDGDGSFLVRPAVLGTHMLVLTDEGRDDRDQRIEDSLEIRRGSNEWSLDLPVGVLVGEAPPGTVLTHVWKNDRGTTCTTHFRSDGHGKFLVEGIPAGSGSIETLEGSIPVEVRAGETTRVEIR